MRFKQYLNEKVTAAAAQKKAKDRFESFQKKAKDQSHLTSMINNRTLKTKDPEKLKAWYEYLEDQNFHDEAELAYKKWKQMSESVNESMQRYAEIWKARNKKWYLNLADREYGEYEDSTTYGPFDTEDEADEYLNNFSNPGGMSIDRSGKKPIPKRSPNGRPVESPERNRGYW